MLLDRIEPQEMSGVFGGMLKELDGRGGLEQFRVLDDGVLLALDGSEKQDCEQNAAKRLKTLFWTP
ncbi:hypothetical protein AGMMS49579_11130 [Spirochaetia bacterium]|nr:hypothetical protein AGMMS49579_11130 [Spirochaetia bacterium]